MAHIMLYSKKTAQVRSNILGQAAFGVLTLKNMYPLLRLPPALKAMLPLPLTRPLQ